jgi:3-hydroxyacyl-CoA dehydrogenase
MGRIKANLASGVKKGKMSQEAADAVSGRVTGTLTYDDFQRVDMVIEAAIEVSAVGGWAGSLARALCTSVVAAHIAFA